MDEVDLEGYQFFASPSDRALLSEILDRLATLEVRDREREEDIALLREENRQKDEEIATLREEIALERAYDRQRLARLEAPAPPLREETARDHLDKLFSEMKRLSIRQTTTKDAARLLGVSKPLIDKLKPYLATDSRFVIGRDPRHKQRHLIRLAGT